MALRVVLDTNVVVAALRSRQGASAAVLLRAGLGEFEFCLSVALFLEYEGAVKRPASGVEVPVAAIDDILDHLAAVGHTRRYSFSGGPPCPIRGTTMCWRWRSLANATRSSPTIAATFGAPSGLASAS